MLLIVQFLEVKKNKSMYNFVKNCKMIFPDFRAWLSTFESILFK